MMTAHICIYIYPLYIKIYTIYDLELNLHYINPLGLLVVNV